jgi:hypothetical protein
MIKKNNSNYIQAILFFSILLRLNLIELNVGPLNNSFSRKRSYPELIIYILQLTVAFFILKPF